MTKYQQLNLVLNVAEVNRLLDKDRSNLLIIDARPFSEYSKGHIPGAVNIELMQFHWIDTSKTGILEFNRQMKILLSNIGIKKESLYDFMMIFPVHLQLEESGYCYIFHIIKLQCLMADSIDGRKKDMI